MQIFLILITKKAEQKSQPKKIYWFFEDKKWFSLEKQGEYGSVFFKEKVNEQIFGNIGSIR